MTVSTPSVSVAATVFFRRALRTTLTWNGLTWNGVAGGSDTAIGRHLATVRAAVDLGEITEVPSQRLEAGGLANLGDDTSDFASTAGGSSGGRLVTDTLQRRGPICTGSFVTAL